MIEDDSSSNFKADPIPKKRKRSNEAGDGPRQKANKKTTAQQEELKIMNESSQEGKKSRKQSITAPISVPENWIAMFDQPLTMEELQDNLSNANPDIKAHNIPMFAQRLVQAVKPKTLNLHGKTYYYTVSKKE